MTVELRVTLSVFFFGKILCHCRKTQLIVLGVCAIKDQVLDR